MSRHTLTPLTDRRGPRFESGGFHGKSPAKAGLRSCHVQEGPETIHDLGAGVPTGTFTVFPGCAGLLIGFANTLLEDEISSRGC
jgi:hypothetical protein